MAAPLSVYREPFHMSAVVRQPERKERGAAAAWDAGREARQFSMPENIHPAEATWSKHYLFEDSVL